MFKIQAKQFCRPKPNLGRSPQLPDYLDPKPASSGQCGTAKERHSGGTRGTQWRRPVLIFVLVIVTDEVLPHSRLSTVTKTRFAKLRSVDLIPSTRKYDCIAEDIRIGFPDWRKYFHTTKQIQKC